MNARRIGTTTLLAVATVLLAGPVAHADTGSADPLAFLGPSGSGGQINLGCLLESLSAGPPSASCDPVQIPVT